MGGNGEKAKRSKGSIGGNDGGEYMAIRIANKKGALTDGQQKNIHPHIRLTFFIYKYSHLDKTTQ